MEIDFWNFEFGVNAMGRSEKYSQDYVFRFIHFRLSGFDCRTDHMDVGLFIGFLEPNLIALASSSVSRVRLGFNAKFHNSPYFCFIIEFRMSGNVK